MVKLTQKPRFNQKGLTVLESLIALFILGCTTVAIMHLIVTGDRIAGRKNAISCATGLAKNEGELLKSYQTALMLPKDTSYSTTVNGIDFDVTRKLVENDSVIIDSIVPYKEYAITVSRKNNNSVSLTFHVLQGYFGQDAY